MSSALIGTAEYGVSMGEDYSALQAALSGFSSIEDLVDFLKDDANDYYDAHVSDPNLRQKYKDLAATYFDYTVGSKLWKNRDSI